MVSASKYGLKAFFILPQSQQNARIITRFSYLRISAILGSCRTDGNITGHNLFVSAYHGFAQLGDEHIPEPAPWEGFPVFSAVFDSALLNEEGQLQLKFRVILSGASEPERYRLHLKADIKHIEEGSCHSWPRVFIAGENCSGTESVVTVTVEDFSTLSGILTGQYKVKSRYLLIDTKTGYRCVAKRLSFHFSI